MSSQDFTSLSILNGIQSITIPDVSGEIQNGDSRTDLLSVTTLVASDITYVSGVSAQDEIEPKAVQSISESSTATILSTDVLESQIKKEANSKDELSSQISTISKSILLSSLHVPDDVANISMSIVTEEVHEEDETVWVANIATQNSFDSLELNEEPKKKLADGPNVAFVTKVAKKNRRSPIAKSAGKQKKTASIIRPKKARHYITNLTEAKKTLVKGNVVSAINKSVVHDTDSSRMITDASILSSQMSDLSICIDMNETDLDYQSKSRNQSQLPNIKSETKDNPISKRGPKKNKRGCSLNKNKHDECDMISVVSESISVVTVPSSLLPRKPTANVGSCDHGFICVSQATTINKSVVHDTDSCRMSTDASILSSQMSDPSICINMNETDLDYQSKSRNQSQLPKIKSETKDKPISKRGPKKIKRGSNLKKNIHDEYGDSISVVSEPISMVTPMIYDSEKIPPPSSSSPRKPTANVGSYDCRFTCVSQATMHQGDNSLASGGGVQCVVMATSGAALSVVKSRSPFSTKEMDTILYCGNETYTQYMNGQTPRLLDPEEIPQKFVVGPYSIEIMKPEWALNGLFPFATIDDLNPVGTLSEMLMNLFHSNESTNATDCYIFTFQSYTVSFWRDGDVFYLFNSHAVDSTGKLNTCSPEVNKARLFKICDVETLAHLLLISANYGIRNNEYCIHRMRVGEWTFLPALEVASQLSSHNGPYDERFQSIARASMHQNDKSLQSGGGVQCVIMAACGAALSVVKGRSPFSIREMDCILKDGNDIYLGVLKGESPRYLCPDEDVPQNLTIGRHSISISSPEWINNGLYPSCESSDQIHPIHYLKNLLLEIFSHDDFNPATDSFIFTFQHKTVSFWCAAGGSFCLYNSHAVDIDGKFNPETSEFNKARLFSIADIETLSYLLLIDGEYGRDNNEYSIHRLRVLSWTSNETYQSSDCDESDSISIATISTNSSCAIVGKRKRKTRQSVFGNKKQKVGPKNQYKLLNPQVQAEAKKKYVTANPDKTKAKYDRYRTANPDKILENNKMYNTVKRHIPAKLRTTDLLIGELSGEQLNDIPVHSLKKKSIYSPDIHTCSHCNARLFDEEVNRTKCCCGQGLYNVFVLPPLTETFYDDRVFIERSRVYNNMFAFSALGTSGKCPVPPGKSFVKIQGRTYHRIFDLSYQSVEGRYTNPLSYYVNDERERLNASHNLCLNREMMIEITHYINRVNPYIDQFKRLALEQSDEAFLVFKRTSRQSDGANLGSNVTSNTEVAAVISNDVADITPRSVAVWKVGQARPHTIPLLSEMYEPLQYTLLYPHGTPGWHLNMVDNMKRNKLTQNKYYRYLVLTDYRFSELGRLSEEWLVDMCCRMIEERLIYLKKVQDRSNLRSAPLDELMNDAERRRELARLEADETIYGEDGGIVPGRKYLPATFLGGPRYMQEKYMNRDCRLVPRRQTAVTPRLESVS